MISFRYAALALLVTAAPAMAQDAQSVQQLPAEYGDNYAPVYDSESLSAPVDSVLYDNPAKAFAFIFGTGFPGGNATPGDPGEFRAGRTTYTATFTNTRTTPFVLTGVRPTYRTSAVSAASSSPPRVQYNGEPPVMAAFPGTFATVPFPVNDSLSAPGSIFQRQLPLITRTVPSTIDMYPLPQFGSPTISLVAPGQTRVSSAFVIQPGQSITFRFQHFNVPSALALKASPGPAGNGTHRIFQSSAAVPLGEYAARDILLYNNATTADSQGPDTFDDLFGYVRFLSDNSFFPSAGENGAAAGSLALGRPTPNPAQGLVELPFAIRDGGNARISVYDVTGREVAIVADRTFGSGGQTAEFDVSGLAAGVYVVVLQANGERATQRLSVVR